MLILSRRPNETIRFPNLGISVSIVSVQGRRVQVGIDAPPEIQIVRSELDDSHQANRRTLPPKETSKKPLIGRSLEGLPDSKAKAKSDHAFKNQLNTATLGLQLAQRQLQAGHYLAADETLAGSLKMLIELEENCVEPSLVKEQKASLRSIVAQRARAATTTTVDVLLVEDDQNEQALLRGLLELEGYTVHTANDGIEALECLNRVSPRFVLLDMMMPNANGRETLNRIRETPAFYHLPVFAVSGSSPDSIGLSIGSDGVDEWFPKPLDAAKLVRRLRNLDDSVCT